MAKLRLLGPVVVESRGGVQTSAMARAPEVKEQETTWRNVDARVTLRPARANMTIPSSATPVAFLYVTDRARALSFYEKLGVTLQRADAFGDYLALNGALLRMTVMADHAPSPHPVLGWNVADLGAIARTLATQGIAFTRYDGMGQDELGIWTAPDGVSKVAFFADPDGNVLSVSQG